MNRNIRSSRFSPSIIYILLIFAFAFISFSPATASGYQVTLVWDENSETNLAGYRVFCRQVDQSYDYDTPAWEGTGTTCTVFDLDDNTVYCFVARAYDNFDNMSTDSNEVRYQPEDSDQPTIESGSQVIIDNGDAGTSSTGTWKVSSGPNPYGDNSLYSQDGDATHSFEAYADGFYEVSIWWTYHSTRCTSVPIEIYDGDTWLDTVKVNQQSNGGQWNVLGTYAFNGTARIVIISEGNCTTCADAVRFAQ